MSSVRLPSSDTHVGRHNFLTIFNSTMIQRVYNGILPAPAA